MQDYHKSMTMREPETLDVEKMGRKTPVSQEVGSEGTDSCSGLVKDGRAGSKEVRQRNKRTERKVEAATPRLHEAPKRTSGLHRLQKRRWRTPEWSSDVSSYSLSECNKHALGGLSNLSGAHTEGNCMADGPNQRRGERTASRRRAATAQSWRRRGACMADGGRRGCGWRSTSFVLARSKAACRLTRYARSSAWEIAASSQRDGEEISTNSTVVLLDRALLVNVVDVVVSFQASKRRIFHCQSLCSTDIAGTLRHPCC